MHNSHLAASFITLKCARDIFMHHNNIFVLYARMLGDEGWWQEQRRKENILIFIFAKSRAYLGNLRS
jgi:hypothetical protein